MLFHVFYEENRLILKYSVVLFILTGLSLSIELKTSSALSKFFWDPIWFFRFKRARALLYRLWHKENS
jgi:hypothetical protein